MMKFFVKLGTKANTFINNDKFYLQASINNSLTLFYAKQET
jgi:hypothetical protein